MTMLDPRTADRLAKLCGLFPSDHDGERASAAAKADQIIRSHGMTWRQVFVAANPQSTRELIDFALAAGGVLTDWERRFLNGIRSWQGPLTEKQAATLKGIFAKVSAQGSAS
jgi:hypothetical protein